MESGSYEGVLLGMGNPLLDISAVVDEAFLAKYEPPQQPSSCAVMISRLKPMVSVVCKTVLFCQFLVK
jgi:hypothetical protein